MRRIHLLLLISLVLLFHTCTTDDPVNSEIKVMTFNVRINLPSDGENAWPHRKEMAASMIRFYDPEIFGVQEAIQGQVQDLSQRLPDYDWFGVGRNDGEEAGEYMAIYYLRSRFKLLDGSTFWLSEHPETTGLGWDAAYIRVVTWAHFEDLKTGQKFYHFNTHFDNRGEVARLESAKLLLTRIKEIAGNEPVIVTGDFNCHPDSAPYQLLTNSDQLRDAKYISRIPHHGPSRTFNRFDLETLKTVEAPIDYIFVSRTIQVLKHATLSDTVDGRFPSDHMPVLAQLIIQPE